MRVFFRPPSGNTIHSNACGEQDGHDSSSYSRVALGIEEFPSLESKAKAISSNPAPNGGSVTGRGNGAAQDTQSSTGWTVDRTVGGTVNGTATEKATATATTGGALVFERDCSSHVVQQPLDDTSRLIKDDKERQEEEEEDVLLAAVVAATNKRGKGGRKGGRGRKVCVYLCFCVYQSPVCVVLKSSECVCLCVNPQCVLSSHSSVCLRAYACVRVCVCV